ncbi:MAG: uncharacterized protein QG635_1621 [Bacteroidota bacterium]|nr:uncharacterized protein [Bacteroidota bacterium]
MLFNTTLLLILVIIFFASLLRSTFGFGDALISMPLLALFLSIKTVTPLVAFMGLLISTAILARNWERIDIRSFWKLILFALLGIPIGLIYLKGAGESFVKIVLAVVLILFSCYKILNPDLFNLKNDKLAFIFGLLSGILGGAYNTNGPPIIVFGTLRGWQPNKFRLILQGIFFPTNLFIVAGHGAAGLWTQEVIRYFLLSLPFMLIAIIIGSKLNKIIPKDKFMNYIYILLIVISCLLLWKTIF